MKKKNLFTLVFVFPLLFINLFTYSAQAQQPLPIGDPAFKQKESFDSNPTTGGYSGIRTPTGTTTNAFDGNLTTNINWIYGYPDPGFVNVTGFKKPGDNGLTDFNITFIDIKIHYRAHPVPNSSDDQYRIVFYLSLDTVELQTWVSGYSARWPHDTNNPQSRVFSNVAKPDGGNWTWTDITNLKIGFENRVVSSNDFQRVYLYEAWITAYSTPYPEAGTISVQPPIIWGLAAGEPFYIDIYVTNVTGMGYYELFLSFNPFVLTPTAWHVYNPLIIQAAMSGIWPDYIALEYHTYDEDPAGLSGSAPICRIYFQINTATGSPLHFENTYFDDVEGNPFTLVTVDGYYRIGEGDFEAPAIHTVSRPILFPNYDQDVTIIANVTDNVQVVSVTLSYTLASQWHNSTMTQINGLYKAVIPAQPYNTTVAYKIYANDASANWAISDTFTYPVADETAPQVSSARIPNQPRSNQTVKIMINATEPASASGVQVVRTYYSVNGVSKPSIALVYNEELGLWEGNLPGQPAHATVEYYSFAQDNVGNRNVTATYSYTVALAGDANLDHVVDVVDAATISAHWHPGPPIGPLGYDSAYDLNNDGVIGIVDGAMVSADWGKTW